MSNNTYKEYLQKSFEQYQDNAIIWTYAFAEKIKELRKEKNLSQKQVATAMGMPVSTYANWEQGRREPNIMNIIDLAGIFEVDFNEMFDLSDLLTQAIGKLPKN